MEATVDGLAANWGCPTAVPLKLTDRTRKSARFGWIKLLKLMAACGPFVAASLWHPLEAEALQDFDVLIYGGWVVDGTGNPGFRADIGIRADEIVALGRLAGATSRRVVDATGLIVTPGFIDMHAHADTAMASDTRADRRIDSFVTQGITTVLTGMDGRHVIWPLSAEIAAYEDPGMTANVVPVVGFNTMRNVIMGGGAERQATTEEIMRMQELLREKMAAGAWGLAAGLEYSPALYASREELIGLASVVAEYDGFYHAHPRSEAVLPIWLLPSRVDTWPVDGFQGLEETIDVARQTGVRVVSTHIKSRGRSSFGRSVRDVELVNQARREGLRVYLDQYPYDTFGTSARLMVPRWAFTDLRYDHRTAPSDASVDRENLRSRLADPATRKLIERDIEYMTDHSGGADRIFIIDHPDTSLIGRTIGEVAAERGQNYIETTIDFALSGYADVLGGALFRGLGTHERDIEHYMQQEFTATGSDGRPVMPTRPSFVGAHPRYMGTFVRKIARYVKDRELITLTFAIRSQTSLPAQIIGLRDRGLLREGHKADIVIFDYDSLRDHATIFEPDRPSEGIKYVLVNGEFVLDRGEFTDLLPGVVIRREGSPLPDVTSCDRCDRRFGTRDR